jgi:hypothetical protein
MFLPKWLMALTIMVNLQCLKPCSNQHNLGSHVPAVLTQVTVFREMPFLTILQQYPLASLEKNNERQATLAVSMFFSPDRVEAHFGSDYPDGVLLVIIACLFISVDWMWRHAHEFDAIAAVLPDAGTWSSLPAPLEPRARRRSS